MTTENTETATAQMPTCWSCDKPMKPHHFKSGGDGWICDCGVTEMPAVVAPSGGRPTATKKQRDYTKRVRGEKVKAK